MPQINDIRELAQQNARYVSNSPQDWMSYLDVAARLYRYSFTDALLIHAQRPDATACAEMELWNQKMSRWVNRGAKGIALLDDTGPRTKLRYVFDIADTHLVRGGKTPLLWNLDSHEHEQAILDHLADTYGLSQTDSMNTALMELAQQLTADNLDEAMDGLAYEVADGQQNGRKEDIMKAIRWLLKLVLVMITLPLILAVWLAKWFVVFLHHCSAWFFYLLGSVLLVTAMLSFLMQQSQGMEALQMLIGGFVIFMIPQVVGSVIVLLELAAVMLRQAWYI